MTTPILAVNFKAYPRAFGDEATKLVKGVAEVQASYTGKVRIIVIAPILNASRLAGIYGDVFAQHADPVGLGAYTGFTPPEALASEGVRGVLVNHSERKILYRNLEKVVKSSKEAGLEVIACADTPGEAAGIAYLRPDMIALEPPELIGTGIPVSRARPEVIVKGVEAVKNVAGDIIVLAGAGITSGEDAGRALELGAQGVLVASAVRKKGDPLVKVRELAESMTGS